MIQKLTESISLTNGPRRVCRGNFSRRTGNDQKFQTHRWTTQKEKVSTLLTFIQSNQCHSS